MYQCHCGKGFETHRARNAHQIVHSDKSTRYSVSRKKNQEIHECLQCKTTFEHSNRSKNKFCSLACTGRYQWETVTIPKIEQGLAAPVSCKKYLKEKFGEICTECGQTDTWNNKPLVLQLDHIDGNSDNNFPINLRLLCPNCHTQTDTFGTKGSGPKIKKITKRNMYLRKYQSSDIIGKRI